MATEHPAPNLSAPANGPAPRSQSAPRRSGRVWPRPPVDGWRKLVLSGCTACALGAGVLPAAQAMGLKAERAGTRCEAPAATLAPLWPMPAAANDRIPDSQAVAGQRDVAWVWLASPTRRYPHAALGSGVHAGSVQALVRLGRGPWQTIAYELPVRRVFEDRVPRLVDIDGDGRDELLLVEADTFKGAALVVLGVREGPDGQPRWVELARGPHAGSSFRWLNPVGVADFDGDGHLDVASVTTPHIGGTLVLHHYRPPELVPYARHMDVSNHRMGALEQRLAVVAQPAGQRPTVLLPDMTHQTVHALRWEAPGQWKELADGMPLPARIDRLLPLPADPTGTAGACAALANGEFWTVTLTP